MGTNRRRLRFRETSNLDYEADHGRIEQPVGRFVGTRIPTQRTLSGETAAEFVQAIDIGADKTQPTKEASK
jgi:hypothetical protein